MEKLQRQVMDWHKKFGVSIAKVPRIPGRSVCDLRLELIHSELLELQHAFDRADIIETADALADLMYVVLGAGVTCGIDLEPVFDEVHRSNMTKMPADGVPIRRGDGEILKPPTWEPPVISTILFGQPDLS